MIVMLLAACGVDQSTVMTPRVELIETSAPAVVDADSIVTVPTPEEAAAGIAEAMNKDIERELIAIRETIEHYHGKGAVAKVVAERAALQQEAAKSISVKAAAVKADGERAKAEAVEAVSEDTHAETGDESKTSNVGPVP